MSEETAIDISTTLVKRGNRYGAFFAVQCVVAQGIKDAMQSGVNWERLSPDKKESLQMIATKISRILNGDPEYHDSWHDIAGYAKLVADTLEVV